MANTNAFPGLNSFYFGEGLVARLIDHDGPNPYPTGGEVVTALSLGFKLIHYIGGSVSNGSSAKVVTGGTIKKGGSTSTLIIWSTRTTGAEVANGTDLTADSCKLLIIGILK
jgi:hypothetical protein